MQNKKPDECDAEFEKWFKRTYLGKPVTVNVNVYCLLDLQEAHEAAWNHRQKEIDELKKVIKMYEIRYMNLLENKGEK
jgi:hypothetical protein